MRSISSQLPSWASRRSSIRLAPAEKMSASLPTTSAGKFRPASRTPACSISIASPPIVFIFEWNSTHNTPSPRSTRLAPAFDRTTVERSLADCSISSPGRRREPADRGSAVRPEARTSRTIAGGSVIAHASRTALDANRVPGFERTKLPAEAPPHRAVDVVDRVGNLGRDSRGIYQCGAERPADEVAGPIFCQEQRSQS